MQVVGWFDAYSLSSISLEIARSNNACHGNISSFFVFSCSFIVFLHCADEMVINERNAHHYPTTNLFVFFKNFAGIGRSSCQVMFIGLLPVCFT